ncbi:MAG: hypothetical protein KIS76_08355 [Pyrinomonadaceae bacterium]|nr:hypothetical protein [Pyrinomonadaceae bacterium]
MNIRTLVCISALVTLTFIGTATTEAQRTRVKFSSKSSSAKPLPACSLTTDDSPRLRGVKLGMSSAEVRETLKIEDRSSRVGAYVVSSETSSRERFASKAPEKPILVGSETRYSLFNENGSRENPRLSGISSASIGFFDDKLFRLRFVYPNQDPAWKSIEEFLDFNADKLNVSRNLWIVNRNAAAANCKDFWIHINHSPDEIAISLFDLPALKRSLNEQKVLIMSREKLEKIPDFEKKQQFQP